MHIMRTANEVAIAYNQPLDPELLNLLGSYADALAEHGDDLQATIIVMQAADTLAELARTYHEQLVIDGRFTVTTELINRHGRWFEIVFVLSDNGDGLVLLVEIGDETDAQLLTACEAAWHMSRLGSQPM
jgi:hypothetical protein